MEGGGVEYLGSHVHRVIIWGGDKSRGDYEGFRWGFGGEK